MPRTTRLSTQLRRAPTQYRPIERLASGGMAEVWRAEAVFEDGGSHEVAIKRVLPELASQPLYYSMFRDEAALGMLLRHHNIVRVYDAREIHGTYIIIMELVDGASLRDLLRLHAPTPNPISATLALHIVREVARALEYAHAASDSFGTPLGIIHRDVSPHNVLLGIEGDVKLSDFGLADASSNQTDKPKEVAGGKLGYLAPEVMRMQTVDARVDIFALGIVLWEALVGQFLFLRDDRTETVRNIMSAPVPSVSSLIPDAPRGVDGVLARALARDKNARFRSAGDFASAIDHVLGPAKGMDRLVADAVEAHLGQRRPSLAPPKATPELAEMLAQELDAFVRAADGSGYDIGKRPLDPSEFGEARVPKKKKKGRRSSRRG